jgi:hypothetical protein
LNSCDLPEQASAQFLTSHDCLSWRCAKPAKKLNRRTNAVSAHVMLDTFEHFAEP